MGSIHLGDFTANADDRFVAHLELAVARVLYSGRAFMLALVGDDGVWTTTLVSAEIPAQFRRGRVDVADLEHATVDALVDSVERSGGVMLGMIASLDTADVADVYTRLPADDEQGDGGPDPRAY